MSFDKNPDPNPLIGKVMADSLTIQVIEGGIKQERELQEQCNTDSQTGLASRRFWGKYVELLDKRRSTENKFLVFLIDIDDLKTINDTLGHLEGDNAIVNTANILRKAFRDEDLLARIGGDEFAAMTVYNKDQNPQELMDTLVGRLEKCLREHNQLQNHEYDIKLSIGGAYNEGDERRPVRELIDIADNRMYLEKQKHKEPKNTK